MNLRRLSFFSLLLFFLFSGCSSCLDELEDGGFEDDPRFVYDEDVHDGDQFDVIDDPGDGDGDGDGSGGDGGDDEDDEFEGEPCENQGELRPCGTDVGECEFGQQLCNNGFWGPCYGGVQPRPESCTGRDESCSGVADDAPDLCQPEFGCDQVGQCIDGECVFLDEPNAGCAHLNSPCTVGVCTDPKAGGCEQVMLDDGLDCDDGNFCTLSGVCQQGVCETSPRDCSDLDDECFEGVCDEVLAQCIAVELPGCFTCDDNDPVADAGPDLEVPPNTPVTLNGSGSFDSTGQNLSYEWYILSAPFGSGATLVNATTATPSLLADVAGEFEICLNVTNESECISQASCMTLTVKPVASLLIELVWQNPEPADFDLHYRAPNGSWFSRITFPPSQSGCGPNQQADSVWFCVPSPDWGAGPNGSDPDGIAENDPYLDVDNLVGDGPENINQDVLFDGTGFRVGVHHFCDYGNGPQEARVRIYVNGELEFEEFHTFGFQEFWEVGEIDISNGGTDVNITSLNGQTFLTSTGACP